MLLIICPKCGSDLVEDSDDNEKIDCIRCGEEFSFFDAKYKYEKLTNIRELSKFEPIKKKQSETSGKGREDYLQIIKEFKKKHRRNENE